MIQKTRNLVVPLLIFALFTGLLTPVWNLETTEAASKKATNAKIHFINFNANSDAILLECNGAFGMVDSGEDNSYPSGSNPRYPKRSGTVRGRGVEKEVISYMEKLGVKRLDFYVATHPHSDHIGNAYKIIKKFKPKRVYIRPYKDSYITDRLRLWDNLYVYDNLINAVKEVNSRATTAEEGITLIQSFDKNAAYADPLRKDKTGASKVSVTASSDSPADTSRSALAEAVPLLPETNAEPDTPASMPDSSDISADNTVSDTEEIAVPEDETVLSGEAVGSDTPSPDSGTQTEPLPEAAAAPAEDILTAQEASSVDLEEALGAPVTDLDTMTEETMARQTLENLEAAGFSAETLPEEIVDQNPSMANKAVDSPSIKLPTSSKPQTAKPRFTLGDGMTIEIMNYDAKLKAPDANYFCLGVKVTANGSTAFLASDINNYNGTEDRLANQLGSVDVLKLGHHGFYGSNSTDYLKKLKPSVAILMGTSEHCKKSMFDTLSALGTRVYITPMYAGSTPATVVNMNANVSSNISRDPKLAATVTSAYSNELGRYTLYKNGRPYVGSGWVKANSKLYYFDPKTKEMKTDQWWKYRNGYYYFRLSGAVATKWYQVDKEWYYSNAAGIMQTGWLKDAEKFYYLSPSGAMVTGAKKIGTHDYFFRSNGSMVTGWYDGKYYNEKGQWVKSQKPTGWQKNSQGYWWRYSNGSYPKNTWKTINKQIYYFNSKGYRVTGFWTVKEKRYYFGSNGVRYTNKWLTHTNGKRYYFGSNGIRYANRWLVKGSNIYRFHSNGTMLTGLKTINKNKYYFHPSRGVRYTNKWATINNKKYYFGSNGIMSYGFKNIGGKKYYFNTDGSMATGWLTLDGKTYYLNTNGSVATGWLTLEGKTYYFEASGALAQFTQWQIIEGKTYYFNGDYTLHYGWLALEEPDADDSSNMVTNYYYLFRSEDVAAYPALSLTAGTKAVDVTLTLSSWFDETTTLEYTFGPDGIASEGSPIIPPNTLTPDAEATPEAPQNTPQPDDGDAIPEDDGDAPQEELPASEYPEIIIN